MTTDRHRNPTFSIRLEPRLRFLVERMAAHERRSVSNYIENCILKTLQDTPAPKLPAGKSIGGGGKPEAKAAADLLDSIHVNGEAARFAVLLGYAPALLSSEEIAIYNYLHNRPGGDDRSNDPNNKNLLYFGNVHALEIAWDHIKAHVLGGKPAYVAENAIEVATSGDNARIKGLVKDGFIMRTLQRVEQALREEQEVEKTGVEKGNPEERRALLRLVEND